MQGEGGHDWVRWSAREALLVRIHVLLGMAEECLPEPFSAEVSERLTRLHTARLALEDLEGEALL